MSETPPALLNALNRAIRGRDSRDAIEANLDDFLDRCEVPTADRAAIAKVGKKRLLAYNSLVFNRTRRAIADFIPGATRRMGGERLDTEVQAFLHEQAPKSPYLREVPTEFVAWASPRWKEDPTLPPYLSDLARHELLNQELRNDPHPIGEGSDAPVDLDRGIRCNATLRILRYDYAVHELSDDEDDETPPRPEPTVLLAVRGRDHKPHYLTIKPRSGFLVEGLQAGMTLKQALFTACERSGDTLDDEILATTAATLADLGEQQVLLGAE